MIPNIYVEDLMAGFVQAARQCLMVLPFLVVLIAAAALAGAPAAPQQAPAPRKTEQSVAAPSAAGQTFKVDLHDEAPYFSPKRLKVPRGATVTWENHGPALTHTLYLVTEDGPSRSGPLVPGQKWSFTFKSDAVIRTSCEIHPYMYGIVLVGEPSASLVAAVESQSSSPSNPGAVVNITEYPMPVPNSVPGILAVDSQDNIWVTLGGGGWGNINHPPLSKFARLTADGDITVYSTPTEASGPSGLLIDGDGILHITEIMGGKIARFDPRKKSIEEFTIPTDTAWPTGLALDGEGNLWFNETKGNKLGRLSPQGVMTEWLMPTPNARPTGMVIDAQGNVWQAQRDGGKVSCFRRDGTFEEYALPTPKAKPAGMAVDRLGRVFVAEREGNNIAMISQGVVREFPLPNPRSGPFFPVVDANGFVWFSETYGNRIGVLLPDTGKIIEFAVPTRDSWPGGLAFDSQGSLWFTQQLSNKVAVISNPTQALKDILAREQQQQQAPQPPVAHGHAM